MPAIDDRPGRKVAAACGVQLAKGEPHAGAAPITTSSGPGTRNMDCARCPCRVSHATTSAGVGAAARTSVPRMATHWSANGLSASARLRALSVFSAGAEPPEAGVLHDGDVLVLQQQLST